ncbi:tetratricopeptide repeat protein [Halobacillus ihumii]|uniref:tetratricopeptide repeat protein n=1 Tax=Halobacillus ihumii TaxID=2686092 RepID=UPI0013D6E60C|nr:hypothetical protein [Halobacillus ihumii]
MVAQVHTVDLFSELTNALRNYNQEESTQLLADLEREFPDSSETTNNEEICAKYVLTSRYYLQYGDIQAAYSMLLKARNHKYYVSEDILYMYAYVSAMYEMKRKNYPKSLEWYTYAEQYLPYNKDPLETADFYHKKAALYYYMENAIQSSISLEQAIRIYKSNPALYSIKIADCELIQGLNYIDLKQYDLAEELFHSSLSHDNEREKPKLRTAIYHNLALLYSKKNLPTTSLRYIYKSLEYKDLHPDLENAYYLLTKELLKSGEVGKGKHFCHKGLKLDNQLQSSLYTLLRELYIENTANEALLHKALSFLQKREKWITTEEYADNIASYYLDRNDFRLASKYFNISLQAKNMSYGRC